jgi:hypothetical protein
MGFTLESFRLKMQSKVGTIKQRFKLIMRQSQNVCLLHLAIPLYRGHQICRGVVPTKRGLPNALVLLSENVVTA